MEQNIALLRNKENERWVDNVRNLFVDKKYRQIILNFLENSIYRLKLDKEMKKLQLIKVNGDYYDLCSCTGLFDTQLKRHLNLLVYEEIDMDYDRKLAVENLTSIVQGELTLGDRKIIRDIALDNFHSNLEKAINGECGDLWNRVSCVRTDMHSWPAKQLIEYGFKIEHSRFFDCGNL
ncbi:MAG TPA: hypothetical protein VMC80_02285 [Patescibacteria group bacterium]|nr:hypothetical protein [Patescibacteria group bacterium]